MTRSNNSNRYTSRSIERSDPWDLMNRIIPTVQKKRFKRQALENEDLCVYNIEQPIVNTSLKFKSKRK